MSVYSKMTTIVNRLHAHTKACVIELSGVDEVELRARSLSAHRFGCVSEPCCLTLWSGTTSRFHLAPPHIMNEFWPLTRKKEVVEGWGVMVGICVDFEDVCVYEKPASGMKLERLAVNKRVQRGGSKEREE